MSSNWNDSSEFRLGGMTRGVRILLIATVAMYFVQIAMDRITGGRFTDLLGLSLTGLKRGCVWQLVTYMFLHAKTPLHVLLNMLWLFMIGPETERAIGTRHLFILYFLSGVLGGIGWLLISRVSWTYCIGASAAVFGLLGAFAALFPNRLITLFLFFILPVTMRAWVLAVVLGLVELLFLVSSVGGNIAYAAHLAGGVAGYLYTRIVFHGPRLVTVRAASPWARLRDTLKRSREITDDDVDRVLDKIAEKGMASLTSRERAMLERASREKRASGR